MASVSTESSSVLLTPAEVERQRGHATVLLAGLDRVLFGQSDLTRNVLVAVLARGHVLLEGLPGLGKTELVKGLAALSGLDWRRVQFTPDLLPGDITGGMVLEESPAGGRAFRFHKGPVFTQVLLADEINRASPKTQSALLEAMQERRVTVLGESHALPSPFFVLATQNPIELEGTYPLPEAQLDRFALKLDVLGVDAPTLERILVERPTGVADVQTAVLSRADLDELFAAVERVFLPRAVANFVARIVSATHPAAEHAPPTVKTYVKYGSSPRGGLALARTARAHALLEGRANVGFDDVRRLARACLGHRLVLDYRAPLDGITRADVVDAVLAAVHELERPLPKELADR
jgi:MoxR-like ATPase